MQDGDWIKEQIRFANSLGNMLNELDMDWSKELNFDSLYDYYTDEFDDIED